jgi:hypothetical protein
MTSRGALQMFAEWLRNYEFVAIWLEGIALVAIFFLDWRERIDGAKERSEQEKERQERHKETAAQMEIWRKQIHADRVAEIFSTLRRFQDFVNLGVIRQQVGPGKDFSTTGNYSITGGTIFPEYLALQEAFYLSKLVSEPLFAFMRERMNEADGLQRLPDAATFDAKLQEFNRKWDIYKMAEKIRELS